jgi:hypothetical protein
MRMEARGRLRPEENERPEARGDRDEDEGGMGVRPGQRG